MNDSIPAAKPDPDVNEWSPLSRAPQGMTGTQETPTLLSFAASVRQDKQRDLSEFLTERFRKVFD